MIIDKLKYPNLSNQSQEWIFITDKVMGGVSSGKYQVQEIEGRKCHRMTGNVSTKNNGGFIQIRTKLNPKINADDYEGVIIKVYGNQKNYNLHLRTEFTLAPWQYYSYTFNAPKSWTEIRAPFNEFKKSNFYQPKNLNGQKIKSIALVAAFKDFVSDVCLSDFGFF